MRKLSLTFFCMISALSAFAQRDVAQERMEQIFEEAKTPYKYGLVVAPEDNHHKIDCPTVFRQGDKWLMTYVVYEGQTAVVMKPGWQKVIICLSGAHWGGFFRTGMVNGIAIKEVDFLLYRIWSGEEAMSFRLIRTVIG